MERITSHVRKSYSNQDQHIEEKKKVPRENRINQKVNKNLKNLSFAGRFQKLFIHKIRVDY